MCQLWEIIPGTAAALPCSQRLTLFRAVKIFLQVSSPLSSHPRLPLHSLPPSSALAACRQCPQPCCAWQRSCSWAELSLCSAARLPSAPSMPGAQPSSAAEDQPKAALSLPPRGYLQVSLGLQGNLLGNRMKSPLMFPPSAGQRHFFPELLLLLSKLHRNITFFGLIIR